MLLSIIVPVYNVAAYLERCVLSLTAPCGQDYEIILVDDGSTDGSGALCDGFAGDPRIRVIHKENGGLASARNAGMAAAQGEYLVFVDSDDYLVPGALDLIAAPLLAHRPDMARYGYRKLLEGRVLFTFTLPYEEGLYQGPALDAIRLDTVSYPHTLDYGTPRILSACTAAFRRSWAEENHLQFRSEREILHEDYLFCVQAVWAAASFYVSQEPLYCYDTRPGSLSLVYRENMMERKRNLFSAYCRTVSREDPEVLRRLDNFYIDCVYDCVTNEASRTTDTRKAIAAIRELLADPCLQQALKRNSGCAVTKKARIICHLMNCRMAATMYWGYRWIKKIKAGALP